MKAVGIVAALALALAALYFGWPYLVAVLSASPDAVRAAEKQAKTAADAVKKAETLAVKSRAEKDAAAKAVEVRAANQEKRLAESTAAHEGVAARLAYLQDQAVLAAAAKAEAAADATAAGSPFTAYNVGK